jgi:hypothetical protein
MEEFKKVCAVIDMQGYIFNNVFYPRELAVCNDSVDISIEIESAFERKAITTSSLQWSYNFQKNNIHGLPLDSIRSRLGLKVQRSENIGHLVKKLYQRVRTTDKPLLACKNQQVAELLTKLEIPHMNLEYVTIEGEICPTLKELDSKIGKGLVWFCPLHTCLPLGEKARKTFNCSLRKSRYIWVWLCGKLVINEVLEELKAHNYEVYSLS